MTSVSPWMMAWVNSIVSKHSTWTRSWDFMATLFWMWLKICPHFYFSLLDKTVICKKMHAWKGIYFNTHTWKSFVFCVCCILQFTNTSIVSLSKTSSESAWYHINEQNNSIFIFWQRFFYLLLGLSSKLPIYFNSF